MWRSIATVDVIGAVPSKIKSVLELETLNQKLLKTDFLDQMVIYNFLNNFFKTNSNNNFYTFYLLGYTI